MTITVTSKQEEMRLRTLVCLSRYVTPRGTLPKGTYDKVAVENGMKKEVVQKLFSKHKHSVLNPATLISCACRKKGSGRKNKISPNELQTMVKSIPLRYRTTQRALILKLREAYPGINISKTTLQRALTSGKLKRKGSAIKPILTEKN